VRGTRLRLDESSVLAAVLDHVANALIVVAAEGRAVHINAAAEQLLAGAGPLRCREGRLRCGNRACGTALRQALEAACDPQSPTATTMLLDDHRHGRLILGISPLTGAGGASFALVVINEECLARRRGIEPLKALFNLTRAEAEIALRIADGATPAEIGAERGVASNTVRGQMKSLAAKLGCARQVEIAAMVKAIPLLPPTSDHARSSVLSLTL
jgi:DNA-binding CsgD family transcriptional regulator